MSDSDKNSIKLQQQNQMVIAQAQEQENDNDNDMDQQNDLNQQQQACSVNAFDGTQTIKKRPHRKLQISNFIMKTYKILQDKRNSSIVEWTEQGNCFIVKDKQNFSKQILPKYFKHSKFSSFVRQLNMYDFHKIRKQKQIPIFKHKYFQESRIDLLHKIKRKSGEDGKQEQAVSKQVINQSQLNIDSRIQISYNIIKPSTHFIPSTKSQIQSLKKQNMQINQNINDITQQIQFLEMSKEKKKQKLVKIITSILFFDLNTQNKGFAQPSNQLQQKKGFIQSLRTLQEHFVKDQQPLSFSEYRKSLSRVYSSLKSSLIV